MFHNTNVKEEKITEHKGVAWMSQECGDIQTLNQNLNRVLNYIGGQYTMAYLKAPFIQANLHLLEGQ